MLRRLWVVMYATLREGLQQPICMLLTLTMLVLTLLQPLVQLHTFGEPGRLVRDGGFGFQLIFGLLIVVFTAGFTLNNELRSGTAAASLVKPISRAEFFAGKLLGVLGVLVIYWICSSFAILIAERASERFIENSRIIGYVRDGWAAGLGMIVPLVALLFAAMPSVFVKAQIDSSNFVKASILLVSPGNSVYSVCGHAALRMECPMHQLDYCFSFEVPETSIRLFSALAGKLRQGLSVAPSKDFLCMYQQEGRKVTSYTLGLNFEEKQRLWKLLDECAAYGLYRRYDYIHHGCAVECADIVQRALSPDVDIQYDSMLVSEKMTLRTIYDKALFFCIH